MSDYRKEIGSHTIESSQILTCDQTGRVVAVFYNDYDIDDVLDKIRKNNGSKYGNNYVEGLEKLAERMSTELEKTNSEIVSEYFAFLEEYC